MSVMRHIANMSHDNGPAGHAAVVEGAAAAGLELGWHEGNLLQLIRARRFGRHRGHQRKAGVPFCLHVRYFRHKPWLLTWT